MEDEFKCFVNQDYNSFSNWLFSLDAYTFTLIATVAGFIISQELTINQQNSLGNFFELLGQVILTINAQNTTLQQNNKKTPGINSNLEKPTVEEELLLIKKEIIKLREDCMENVNDKNI